MRSLLKQTSWPLWGWSYIKFCLWTLFFNPLVTWNIPFTCLGPLRKTSMSPRKLARVNNLEMGGLHNQMLTAKLTTPNRVHSTDAICNLAQNWRICIISALYQCNKWWQRVSGGIFPFSFIVVVNYLFFLINLLLVKILFSKSLSLLFGYALKLELKIRLTVILY